MLTLLALHWQFQKRRIYSQLDEICEAFENVDIDAADSVIGQVSEKNNTAINTYTHIYTHTPQINVNYNSYQKMPTMTKMHSNCFYNNLMS